MSAPLLDGSAPVVVGITGASGAILGFRVVKELVRAGCAVELVLTEKAILVAHQELALSVPGPEESRRAALMRALELDEAEGPLVRMYGNNRLDAPPSSGTHLTRGMVIVPCSMTTLGRIAHGISDNLVARAADVTLKEQRKLILVPREAPLSTIHLGNMLSLSRMGVVMLPPMLSFYSPEFRSMEGQIRYTVGKVLDQLGVSHTLFTRWGEDAAEGALRDDG